MKCACQCGEEFAARRVNQKFVNAAHREKARNRRHPVKRLSKDQVALLDSPGARQEGNPAMVTMSLGKDMAQTKQQRKNEAMRRQQSSEFLSPLQVARLLGMSAWNLLLWRKKGFGPPFLRVTRNTIRYPKQKFNVWLASLSRT